MGSANLPKDSIWLAWYSRRSTGEEKMVEVDVAPNVAPNVERRSMRVSR
jgi:hypothetical protein